MTDHNEPTTAPEHEVKVQVGFTTQPEPYESIRYDLALTLKGKPGETPDDTFSKASRWVEARVVQKLEELAENVEKQG